MPAPAGGILKTSHMLPKKELNIYPKSDENLAALISFYFDKYEVKNDNGLETLKVKTSLTLNQVEFILRKLSEAYETIFRSNLKGQIAISNLFTFGIDALTDNEVNGSENRKRITQEFKDFVRKTEIDFNFLEKNN